jgi:hypothetical protein
LPPETPASRLQLRSHFSGESMFARFALAWGLAEIVVMLPAVAPLRRRRTHSPKRAAAAI